MPATAVKSKYYSHNGAYGHVCRGVQKMNTRVHRYEGTNFKSLQCINLDTATDPCMGSGSLFLNAKKYSKHLSYIKYYGQELMTSTYNLARMNMFLHGIVAENQHLRNADTLDAD